ncbi:radical SAM family heme chaperone HemW [Heyndrickxia sporothermodurans]|uniref:Heme chaperone HemW n=1 Tax=Heyndrickxia sporothermodurans TaxID=46224 RepID=A0AB37H7Y2_9BACI|nr:radical SAM family heme chaperone HemW [Heyndrickxia sporothermodurans]MBL5767430.1 oxygen-independent coproporphyrinogen III oxidase [Heyndrickxia sporothermodurans]MBL5770866.1 oxygen-independent coproporphyrinogen III oxidase [Heyndrickxia sporothermodurans]MBL5774941.1 oxygen-independent coproporphyrinogen III oxidase [Heyndrickxia sporothermodurans]MBL5778023.1 oxygen-independent coproporphyrinogen III oxidase [Heyndrickxia sporothermodurans]MBL5781702.1 oxygen-independent coproporphyr
MQVESAYIHIPFCEHICYYCDFNKVFLKGQPVDDYVDKLVEEMKYTIANNPTNQLKTIFVGGGTPTVLNENQLKKLCEGIRTNLPFEDGEFTFEANPGDLSEDKLRILKEYGVNRLSFGVQSFNDELLKKIGRTHTSKEVYQTVHKAQSAGFTNISIDLIYSLPGQTEEDFKDTLSKAFQLELPHYSSYSLIVEPKTIFYNLMKKGKLHLPSEESEANMYSLLMDEMGKHGYEQYEISNFSKPGYESRHNLVYWNNEEYYGFGAGAHGYVDGMRQSNIGPIKKYIEKIQDKQLPIFETNVLTPAEMMEEHMFLGLRKNEGISISQFNNRFDKPLLTVFEKPIKEMIEKGWLEIVEGYVRLTKTGRFFGNEVFQSFLVL